MTLPKQTSLFTEEQLIFSQEDSPASHSVQQENKKGLMTNAIYGQKCLEQYDKFNRPSLWGKMFPDLLIGQGEWYSSRCKLIWKMKATRSHRLYFQLRAQVPRTEGIEFGSYVGLYPTPAAMDATGIKSLRKDSTVSNVGFHSMSLSHFLAQGLLPTPTTSTGGANRKNGLKRKGHGDNLKGAIGLDGQHNPLFIMEMMGFPENWTVLPFLNGGERA